MLPAIQYSERKPVQVQFPRHIVTIQYRRGACPDRYFGRSATHSEVFLVLKFCDNVPEAIGGTARLRPCQVAAGPDAAADANSVFVVPGLGFSDRRASFLTGAAMGKGGSGPAADIVESTSGNNSSEPIGSVPRTGRSRWTD